MKYKTAIILCGGKGTRLGQIGKKLPKSLVKIQNLPIIYYILKSLKKNSFNHFILPLGYKGEQIKKYIEKNNFFKNYNIELINTGKDKPISERIEMVKKNILSDDFVILNGDAIFNFDLKNIFMRHKKKKNDITFLGCAAPLSYGIVGIAKNKIVSFERETMFNSIRNEKRKNFNGYIFSGISILNNKIFQRNFSRNIDFERQFYPKIIKRKNCDFFLIKDNWFSIDSPKDIKMLNQKGHLRKFNSIKKIKNILKKYN